MPRENIGRPPGELKPSVPYLDLTELVDITGTIVATSTFQTALTEAASQKLLLYTGQAIIAVDGPLEVPDGCCGIVMDKAAYGAPGDPGIYVVGGSGYTVLSFDPMIINQLRVNIYGVGTAPTVNGVYFNNVQQSQIQKIRVFNLNGFGFKAEKLWDSTVLDVSVEKCGNATEYAFQLRGGGDTTNMTHIGRVQVEQAYKKAILIDDSSLGMVIDCIHSERADADPLYTTWDIGSTRGVFNEGRFTALTPSDASIIFRGENATFNSMAVEGAIPITFDATSTSTMTFIAPNFGDSTNISIDTSDHSGLVQVLGGMMGTFNPSGELGHAITVECVGTKISTVHVGDVGNPSQPEIVTFRDCPIGALTSGSSNAAATFDHCRITNAGTLLGALTVFQNGCEIGSTTTVNVPSTGAAIIRDSNINANMSITSGGTALGYNCHIFGSLTNSGTSSLFDLNSFATGTVTGIGKPTTAPNARALLGGAWQPGMTGSYLSAAAGTPPGFMFTSGATWKNFANLET